jgi:hypothetical protein
VKARIDCVAGIELAKSASAYTPVRDELLKKKATLAGLPTFPPL